MALSDRLAEPTRQTGGTPCSLGAMLATLEGAELDALQAMLGTPERRGWTAPAIYEALRDEGYSDVAMRSINHHRGGRCRCAKAAA